MGRMKSSMELSFPAGIQPHKLHSPLTLAHVPKIRFTPLKLSFCPCPPDSMMMQMIGRIVIGHEQAVQSANRMKIPAALQDWTDIRARQFFLHLIIQQSDRRRPIRRGLGGEGETQLCAIALSLHPAGLTGDGCSALLGLVRDQLINRS